MTDLIISKLRQNPVALGKLIGFNRLSKPHREWINFLFFNKNKSNSIPLLAHRGSYKTTMLLVAIIYILYFHPETRILYRSATASNTEKFMRQVKALYYSESLIELYKIRGIENIIAVNNWRAESISLTTKKEITKEGNFEAASIQTVVTGRHFDIIINDDIASQEDRFSAAKREQTKQAYQDELSIIEPGGVIATVGTRYHKDDVYSTMPAGRLYPLGSVQIQGLTPDAIDRIQKTQSPSYFASQYLLQIIPETDKLFKWPQFYSEQPERLKLIAWLDPAFTEHGDFSAIAIGGQVDNKIYIVAGYIWQTTIDESYKTIISAFERFKFNKLYVESNAAQRLIVYELQRLGIPTEERVNSKHKHLRITNYVLKNWDDILFYENIERTFLDQIMEYTETSDTHDDAPDSLAGLLSILRPAKPEFKFTFHKET